MKIFLNTRTVCVLLILSLLLSLFLVNINAEISSEKIVGSRVETINGQTAFVVDYGSKSVVMDDIPYVTYSYNRKNVEYMANSGTKTFSFVVTFGDSADLWTKPVWIGQDNLGNNIFDYSLLDERINMTLSVCPDARILIRFYMGVPSSWLNKSINQDARVVTMKSDGSKSFYYANNVITADDRYYYSISSPKVKQEMGRALKEVITRMETIYSGNILGYNLTGLATEEWYRHGWHSSTFDDYSLSAEEEFKNYLRKKYVTDEALRIAWSKPSTFTFSQVSIPHASRRVSRTTGGNFLNTSVEMDLIDFLRFYNESVPDFIDSIAGYAKQAVPNKIIGCIYGYQFEFGSDPASGANALGKLSRSENIDFIKFEAGATFRYYGKGGDNYRGPADSVMLNGKVTILDNDSATSMFKLTDAFKNADPSHIQTYETTMPRTNALTDTPALSGAIQKRIIGFAGANGFIPTFFDLHGGYYNDVTIRKAMAEAEKIYKAGMTYDRKSNAQVLLVTDEASCDYMKNDYIYFGNSPLAEDTRRLIKNLMKSGMSYDSILVEDFDKINLSQYKLIYFMSSYNATSAQRSLIESVKGGNRTVVWAYAPGLFNNHLRSNNNMYNLTNINIVTSSSGTNQVEISNNTDFGQILARITGNAKTTMTTNRNVELFSVNDTNAVIIGRNGSISNMAYRKFSNWTSMYVPFAGLSIDILRAIGEFAGVHIYTERFSESNEDLRYDTISAGKNLIYIHANGTRQRTIKFPSNSDVYDPLTNNKIASNVKSLTLSMNNGETKAIRIQSVGSLPFDNGEPLPEILDPSIKPRSLNGYLKIQKDVNLSYDEMSKVEYRYLRLEAGKSYKLSYRAKIPTLQTGQSITAMLGWYDNVQEKSYTVQPAFSNASYPVSDNQWHYYTSTITIPAKNMNNTNPSPGTSNYYTLSIYAGLNNGNNTSLSDLYLDDVQIIQVNAIDYSNIVGATGLITNGNFTQAIPDSNWYGLNSLLSIEEFSKILEYNVYSGNKSIKVNRKSPRANYTGLSLTAEKTYTLTYWVKTQTDSPVGVTFATIVPGAYPLQIIDYSSNILLGGYSSSNAIDNQWHQYRAVIKPAITSNIFSIGIDSRPGNMDFYIDDVVLVEGNSTENLIEDFDFENALQSHYNNDGNGWPTANWINNRWFSEYAFQVHEYSNPDGPKALMIETIPTGNLLDVYFYSQGGSLVSPIKTNLNNKITQPPNPTKQGYTLSGWYKEPNCINKWNFATDTVVTDTVLYAKWKNNIPDTISPDDSTIDKIIPDDSTTISNESSYIDKEIPDDSSKSSNISYFDETEYSDNSSFAEDSSPIASIDFESDESSNTMLYVIIALLVGFGAIGVYFLINKAKYHT